MYKTSIEDQKVYVSKKTTDKQIHRYEYKKSAGGWWITQERYSVEAAFPERFEMWLPDEVVDHITACNAKNKLNS